MMEWTDRHCRFFHRLLTRRALLYAEMLTVGAVLHGDRARLLRYDAAEHPLALQLGGSDPHALAASARIGESNVRRAVVRVVVGGALGLAFTWGVGHLFGTAIG